MVGEVLSRWQERKAKIQVLKHAYRLKQYEREIIFDTMLALANKGQLTPERMTFFLTVLKDEAFKDIECL